VSNWPSTRAPQVLEARGVCGKGVRVSRPERHGSGSPRQRVSWHSARGRSTGMLGGREGPTQTVMRRLVLHGYCPSFSAEGARDVMHTVAEKLQVPVLQTTGGGKYPSWSRGCN